MYQIITNITLFIMIGHLLDLQWYNKDLLVFHNLNSYLIICNPADIFIENLGFIKFEKFRSWLGLIFHKPTSSFQAFQYFQIFQQFQYFWYFGWQFINIHKQCHNLALLTV